MSLNTPEPTIQSYLPLLGDMSRKRPIAYQASRGAVKIFNALQMAVAESYINGLEVPDSVLRSLFDTCMPILFKHFPSLLAPYDWVLNETDHVAEGSQDLMKVQYDLPQKMFKLMLGDWDLMYPKYTMALWERGATDLEQAQMHMIDDAIEKLGIQDGDHVLDVGCGWAAVPNYVMSKFPNVRFTGLSLSHEQCEDVRHRMADPKSYLSSDRFTLVEGDFNTIQFEEKFDKVLSMGVFCHVGNLTHGFEKIASFLKPKGQFFLHIITVRLPNNVSSVYTHRYIFPHGRYWMFDAPPARNQHLTTVKRWYMNGNNYSKTFASWLQRFDDHYDDIKDLDYGIDFLKFRRIWRFYLIWFVSNFASCDGDINGNGQFLMTLT
ncbi:MAG: methyltransferase domain-containing protein [Leptolyngbya sp. DLM2.Bin15]|nr:MAG: methyltransferase domain-containing protein [Leptolyngbya sp. DLM2.Bin15]